MSQYKEFNVKLCPSPVGSHNILLICTTYVAILSSVQIAKYLGITLVDELPWSSRVHSIHAMQTPAWAF